MNRCDIEERAPLRRRVRLLLAAFLAFPFFLHAQESIHRDAPRDVVLGKMTVVAPPVIQMDGKDDRLSPGARIRDLRNMLVLSGGLAGQTVPVVYRRDPSGLVHEVWLLSADEYKKLGGISTGSQDGVQQFINTLATIFGARP